MNSSRCHKGLIIILSALVCAGFLAASFAEDFEIGRGSSRFHQPRLASVAPADAPAILAVLVTDLDPTALADQDRLSIRASRWTGPFAAQETDNLYVLSVLDRRVIGTAPFDLVVKFKLPDGSTYQTRTVPVDPTEKSGRKVFRPDLAPKPIRVMGTGQLGVLSRVIPSEDMLAIVPAFARFTSVRLPVSGTWITQHNLYGTWTIEISLKRGREILATSTRSFEMLR